MHIAPGGTAKYLEIDYVTEGQELVATISLATNGFRDRVRVAVVRVPLAESITVEELRKYWRRADNSVARLDRAGPGSPARRAESMSSARRKH